VLPKLAVYDLGKMPTTYDFAVFAVMAKSLQYAEIRFVVGMTDWKYPADIGWKRWANICIPICKLAGIPFSVGGPLQGDVLGYGTGQVENLFKKQGRVIKLKPTFEYPRKGYVTITMRESFRNKWRDSNRAEWAKIGEWLAKRGEEVIVLEECERQPLCVEERMAIYANAKMNLAVGNGPMVLCWLSEAPYLSFQLPKPEGKEKEYAQLVEQWTRLGFPVGSQLSFRNPKQEIVWGPDDFETVTSHYKKMFDAEDTRADGEASPSVPDKRD
jgi:hypothetical protein